MSMCKYGENNDKKMEEIIKEMNGKLIAYFPYEHTFNGYIDKDKVETDGIVIEIWKNRRMVKDIYNEVCKEKYKCEKTKMLKKTLKGRIDFIEQLGGTSYISWTAYFSEINESYKNIESFSFTASDELYENEFQKRIEFIEKYNPKVLREIEVKEKMRKLYDTSETGEKYYRTLDVVTHKIIRKYNRRNESIELMDKEINELMSEKMEEAKRVMERQE